MLQYMCIEICRLYFLFQGGKKGIKSMRSRITKNAIANAFMKLLSQRSFEKITVRDIVDECNLTRNTFYYYYQDTYDIVDYILTREISKIITAQESPDSEAGIDAAFEFIIQNPKPMYHLLKSPKRDELDYYFKKAIGTAIDSRLTVLEGSSPISPQDRQLIITIATGTIISTIGEWVLQDPTRSIKEDLKRSMELFGGSLARAVQIAQTRKIQNQRN